MIPRNLLGAPAFAILASIALSAALAGGACGDTVPSDQGGKGGTATTTTSSTTTPTTSTTTTTSGTGGAGTSDGAPAAPPTAITPSPPTSRSSTRARTRSRSTSCRSCRCSRRTAGCRRCPDAVTLSGARERPPTRARLGLSLAAGAVVASLAGPALAQDEPGEARLRRQEERLGAVEEQLRRKDEQIAALLRRRRSATPPGPRSPPWEAALRALRAFRLSGFIQADAVIHRQSSQDEIGPTGQLLNQDRFSIPRAHLRLDAEKWMLLAAVEIEGSTTNGPALKPVEANLSFRWQGPDPKGPPLVTTTLGLMKIPFGFEVPELDPHRFFLERSTVSRALFPGTYDLGFRVQGGYRFLRYAFAVMNGEPIGESTYPGRDPNAAKDLVGRIGIDASPTPFLRIRAGVSALTGTGFHQGTPATKDTLVWRDSNGDGLVQITEIQIIPGAPATPSQNYRRFALGADLGATARLPVLGELTLYGEVVRATNLDRGVEPADPVGAGRSYRELGFYVGLTQEVTRYAMVGVRYDRYDPDADATLQQGVNLVPTSHAYTTTAVTGAARYPPGRLLFEYDHNTNMLGRTAGGLPTTLADDAFTLRGEVVF